MGKVGNYIINLKEDKMKRRGNNISNLKEDSKMRRRDNHINNLKKHNRSRRVEWLFISLLISILIILPSVVGLGISPGRTTLDYSAGLEKEIDFSIYNNKNKDMAVQIIVEGDLKNSITLLDRAFEFRVNDSFMHSKYDLILSDELVESPGLHTARIVVLEIPKTFSGETSVGATVAVASQLYVNVPYPGKYIDADISILNVEEGTTASLLIPLINRGQMEIENVNAVVEIYNINDEMIESIETESIPIGPGIRKELAMKWIVNVSTGDYLAKVRIDFDGETKEFEKEFSVGVPTIKTEGIYISDFRLGEIAKLEIVVENKWNQDLEDVYATLILYKDDELVANLRSTKEDIPALDKRELIIYWDTKGIEEGEYYGEFKIYYGEKVSETTMTLMVYKDRLEIIGYDFRLSSEKEDYFLMIIRLIISTILTALMLVIFFWLMSKKKRKKKNKRENSF